MSIVMFTFVLESYQHHTVSDYILVVRLDRTDRKLVKVASNPISDLLFT